MFERFFSRSGRSTAASPPASSLAWDIHSHIIPEVDDGMRSFEESVEAIRGLQSLGYRGGVVTPHIYHGIHDNDAATLRAAFVRFRDRVLEAGIEFDLRLGAEYFVDEHLIELVERDELLSFGPDDKHVLIEFPYTTEPMLWEDALGALTRRGYEPVIAHVERYMFVAANLQGWLDRLRSYPIHIQCNLGSLTGQFGKVPQRIATKLKADDEVAFWGSDLHRPHQIERFIRPALAKLNADNALNPTLGFPLPETPRAGSQASL